MTKEIQKKRPNSEVAKQSLNKVIKEATINQVLKIPDNTSCSTGQHLGYGSKKSTCTRQLTCCRNVNYVDCLHFLNNFTGNTNTIKAKLK